MLILCIGISCATAGDLKITFSSERDGTGLENAVVELMLPETIRINHSSPVIEVVDQRDKEFVQDITVIVKGSRVDFPNSDDILHHVYSFSRAKEFELPLYGKSENSDYYEVFDDAGLVMIGCNIHDWMLGYIYVAESNKVAISDEEGVAIIKDLPQGTYPIKIWHALGKRRELEEIREVTILATGSTEFTISLSLNRDRRLRRAPTTTRRRYR